MRQMNEILKQAEIAKHEADLKRFDSNVADGDPATPDELQYRSAVVTALDALKALPADNGRQSVGAERDEFLALRDGLQVRNYVNSAFNQVPLDGREAEYNAERKLRPGDVPLVALLPRDLQHRADTTVVAGEYETSLRPVVQQVFASSDLAFLGANIFSSPVGSARIPVIGGTGTASVKAKAASTTAVDAMISTKVLNPERYTIAGQFSLEEEYAFAGIEGALRAYLAGRMVEELDDSVMNTATSGILAELASPSTSTTVVAYGDLSQAIAARVDGKAAGSEGEIAVLLGAKSYEVIAKPTSAGLRELREVREDGTRVKASAHIPAPASDNQTAILVAKGGAADLNIAIWEAARLIRTDVAATGQVRIDLHGFWDWKFAREDYWLLDSFHLA